MKNSLRKIIVFSMISFAMLAIVACGKLTTTTNTTTSQTVPVTETSASTTKAPVTIFIPTRSTTTQTTSPITTVPTVVTTTTTAGITTTTTTIPGTTTTTTTTTGSNPLDITMAYYESAEGLSGTSLMLELREIINTGFLNKTYGDSRYILNISDADPNNSSKVILMYTGYSVNGAWDGGTTWNREHVWPQSLLGVSAENNVRNAASDLQNLKPANPTINSTRGYKYFGTTTTSQTYELRPEDRGDIARILLYMVVMYSEYTLVESNPSVMQMAQLSLLLQWHIQDPVDDFERHRNDVIYSYQKNRNPFIDYPQFVDLIW